MSTRESGYVVVEFNQASGRPELASTDVHDDVGDANDQATAARERTAAVGRKERYAVAALTLLEEPT